MSGSTIEDLQAWVGHEEIRTDSVREPAIVQFRATLEGLLVEDEIAPVPPGFHWTLFQPMAKTSELGEDGHPRHLSILPQMPLPSRMWAGGEVSFLSPLKEGDTLLRKTVVESIREKTGGSGRLIFVTLAHEILAEQSMVIREKQTLVYREARHPSGQVQAPPESSTEKGFSADSAMLFRYSALTFNTHRIHYDRDYAVGVEGYPDLVVHGPLQATLLMNAIASKAQAAEFRFAYRGVAPLYCGQPAAIFLDGAQSGKAEIRRSPGDVTMIADFDLLKR